MLPCCPSTLMRRLLISWLLIACTLPGMAGAKLAYPFSVSAERSGAGHDLIARNRGPAPVSVRLTLTATENVTTTQPLPVLAVVRPHSELLLLQIRPAVPGRGHRFSTQSTFSIGSFYAIPDPRASYRLPYQDGRSFVISQAAGGPLTTHNTDESEYAVDFTMPENTPVVAARDGVVIETESANRSGSTWTSQNTAIATTGTMISTIQVRTSAAVSRASPERNDARAGPAASRELNIAVRAATAKHRRQPGRAAGARPGLAAGSGVESLFCQPLSSRIQWRPAPAHRNCARLGPRPGTDRG